MLVFLKDGSGVDPLVITSVQACKMEDLTHVRLHDRVIVCSPYRRISIDFGSFEEAKRYRDELIQEINSRTCMQPPVYPSFQPQSTGPSKPSIRDKLISDTLKAINSSGWSGFINSYASAPYRGGFGSFPVGRGEDITGQDPPNWSDSSHEFSHPVIDSFHAKMLRESRFTAVTPLLAAEKPKPELPNELQPQPEESKKITFREFL